MTSTLDPDAKQHQRALQLTTMQAFIRLMKSDDHNESHYWEYIKDMKFLLDSHVLQLQGHEPKDVVKMIKPMIHDPECKFLLPTESTKESNSDEGMPQEFDTPSKADIMAEFPKEMLTPEVRTNIANVIKHMEALHSEAAELMKCMKKLFSHNTGWCILSDTTSHGAALHHDSMLMTLPHQIRWTRMPLYSFPSRYGSRWEQVSTSASSCPNSCCDTTLPSQEWSWYQGLHHTNSKTVCHPGEAVPSSTEGCMLWTWVLRNTDI